MWLYRIFMATTTPRRGRRRDAALDDAILDAALAVLADSGYDGLTIDLVAERASTARASVYRRWPTKADLVLAAVRRMNAVDIDLDDLPDTGTLRGDMVAAIVPETFEEQQRRIRIVTGLLAVTTTDPLLAEEATRAGIGPWIDLNRALLDRAVARGEYATADTGSLAQVIPMICIARVAVQRLPITREFSVGLIDGVILPALRAGLVPPTPFEEEGAPS